MKATDIIFKAKSASTGEWVQGNYINSFSPGIIHNQSFQGNWSVIDPETLCIGFKDEFGNFWFSGDKVELAGEVGIIDFSDAGFWISFGKKERTATSHVSSLKFIENIHD